MLNESEYNELVKSREQRNIILETERERLIKANNQLGDRENILINSMSEIRANSLVIIEITKLLNNYINSEA